MDLRQVLGETGGDADLGMGHEGPVTGSAPGTRMPRVRTGIAERGRLQRKSGPNSADADGMGGGTRTYSSGAPMAPFVGWP